MLRPYTQRPPARSFLEPHAILRHSMMKVDPDYEYRPRLYYCRPGDGVKVMAMQCRNCEWDKYAYGDEVYIEDPRTGWWQGPQGEACWCLAFDQLFTYVRKGSFFLSGHSREIHVCAFTTPMDEAYWNPSYFVHPSFVVPHVVDNQGVYHIITKVICLDGLRRIRTRSLHVQSAFYNCFPRGLAFLSFKDWYRGARRCCKGFSSTHLRHAPPMCFYMMFHELNSLRRKSQPYCTIL